MPEVFIIAEAGVNHNGSLEICKKLIDVSVKAGADAVKFQTFRADRLVTATASRAEYQVVNTGTNESQFEMLEQLELSPEMHRELFSYCNKNNIIFMSTPFDEESADMLDDLGMDVFKISSGEITNKPLIQHIVSKKKPIILSTGMSYLGEVENAISWIDEIWDKLNINPKLTLLHCVSNYPARIEDVNLNAIKTMKLAFGLPIGYSDHTMGIEIPVAAVAIGARVIEKHFTIDRNLPGPDHKASLEPNELEMMIRAIRNVEKALGSGIKRPVSCEYDMRIIARKSLVAKRNIRENDIFTAENVTVKRPGAGICPSVWNTIIGRKAVRDFKEDELIEI